MGDTYHRKKRHVGEDNVEVLDFDTESATNDTKVDEHLLDFYRNALDRLEKERKEWLMLLEGCKLAPADEVMSLEQKVDVVHIERILFMFCVLFNGLAHLKPTAWKCTYCTLTFSRYHHLWLLVRKHF